MSDPDATNLVGATVRIPFGDDPAEDDDLIVSGRWRGDGDVDAITVEGSNRALLTDPHPWVVPAPGRLVRAPRAQR